MADSIEAIVTRERARVRLHLPWWLRPFLLRDVVGITIGRTVYLRAGIAASSLEALLRHELEHVRQRNRLGLTRFWIRYAAEYLGNRRRGMSSADAYRHISFEREAAGAEKGAESTDV